MSNEFFRDGQWLDAHGGLVEPHTAEEYFSGSQWYDRTCLNEQWKIQGVQPTDEVRSRSAGIEYRMVHLQPPVPHTSSCRGCCATCLVNLPRRSGKLRSWARLLLLQHTLCRHRCDCIRQ